MELRAYAKINWLLNVLGRREDGYHLLDMLMQSISLYDQISFEESDTIQLLPMFEQKKAGVSDADGLISDPVPYDDRNLVVRAAKKLREYCGISKGAVIRLGKHIPSGAGLGGGSADGALTLLGLNELWKLNLSVQELLEIGVSLGADIPFLLWGGFARVRGIGEQVVTLPATPKKYLVLIQPCGGLSTPEVYHAYDQLMNPAHTDLDPRSLQEALISGDPAIIAHLMYNDLESAVFLHRPVLKQTIRNLEENGAVHAMMTGSGSVVFGVFKDAVSARNAYEKLSGTYRRIWLADTLNPDEMQMSRHLNSCVNNL